MKLGSAPPGDVLLRISGAPAGLALTDANGNDLTAPGAGLEFTAANWRTAQQVTATALDDADAADVSASLAHFVSGPGYVSRPALLPVTVDDDETAGLVLSDTELEVDEQGGRPGASR